MKAGFTASQSRYASALITTALLTPLAWSSALDFSHQTGSRNWDNFASGTTWRFADVRPDLDMVLTLDSLTAGTKVKVHPLGDQLKVTVKGRSGADRMAHFSANFVHSTLGTPVALAPEFLLTDIDHHNDFSEQVWFDHVASYDTTADTHLVTSIVGDTVTSQGTALNTNRHDDRAWLGLTLTETSAFQFGWGFEGLSSGKGGNRQRGLVFGGTAVVNFARATTTPVPEPSAAALLLVGILFWRR
jgi:hypothetical protein